MRTETEVMTPWILGFFGLFGGLMFLGESIILGIVFIIGALLMLSVGIKFAIRKTQEQKDYEEALYKWNREHNQTTWFWFLWW